MTLAEFCTFTKVAAKPHKSGALTMYDSQVLREDRWALHHLTDYVVSSIAAGTIWLVERASHE
jgi:hypothetical protein